jgi:large subunit ribosomal protein L18e
MDTQRTNLVNEARKQETPFWQRIADELAKPSRRRREVNLSRIARASKKGDVIIVPGKVLGSGEIAHEATVVAYSFSSSALSKLKEANCTSMSLQEFLKKNPDGSGRIIG